MRNNCSHKTFFLFLFLFFLVLPTSIKASIQYYFYVQLADKNNSAYSIYNPAEFLSPKSIQRRIDFNIPIDSTDLPVNQTYIQSIQELGVTIHSTSKWMNGLTVIVSDSNVMQTVRSLQCVKFTAYTGKIDGINSSVKKRTKMLNTYNYGTATAQMNQLNAKVLHDAGFRGKGIHIALIDAGFKHVDVNQCFDSLRLNNQLLGTKDIISSTSNIFDEDEHGADVLSTMAANLPNQYLGTAPDASYWLIRTEYVPTEYLVEVDFWVSGIEYADSVGVDVVNSSLGYTIFDDNSMNFSYSDMNGLVSRASRAATMASEKGILVCNSAGNDGSETWKYIGSPADAKGILTVGSVTETGTPSYFTSFGPTVDGRIKPEVCARGSNAAVVLPNGSLSALSGTSFSSPILAGVSACLLQAYRAQKNELDLEKLRMAILQSSSSYYTPNAQIGYGVPDFQKAMQTLGLYCKTEQLNTDDISLHVDVKNKKICIQLTNTLTDEKPILEVYSSTGKLMMYKKLLGMVEMVDFAHLPSGIYVLRLVANDVVLKRKFLVR